MTDRYTDQEIVELYRRGRRDPYIMDKLCDLTLMPEDKLLSILHLAGEALEISRTQKRTGRSRKISDQVWREIIALRLQGVGYAEITASTGVHRGSLNNWRLQAERLGIPVPDHRVSSVIGVYRQSVSAFRYPIIEFHLAFSASRKTNERKKKTWNLLQKK